MHLVVDLGVKRFLVKISKLSDEGAIAHAHHSGDEAVRAQSFDLTIA